MCDAYVATSGHRGVFLNRGECIRYMSTLILPAGFHLCNPKYIYRLLVHKTSACVCVFRMILTVNNDLFPQTAVACFFQTARAPNAVIIANLFTGLEYSNWVRLGELLNEVPALCRVTRSQDSGWSRSVDSGCVKPSTCTETRVRARTRAQAHVVRTHLDGDTVFVVMWELNCVRISDTWNRMPCRLVQACGRFGGTCRLCQSVPPLIIVTNFAL